MSVAAPPRDNERPDFVAALGKSCLVTFLVSLGIVVIYPLLWMALNGFKTNAEIFGDPFALPAGFSFSNYVAAWNQGIRNYVVTSVIVTLGSAVCTVLVSAWTAYGLTRSRLPGKPFFVGIVLGGFVGGLIMASAGGLHGGPWLARTGRAGVIVLAVFMALQELGIATDIVTTAFAILFGAVALALSLSFGLGNRELAGEVTREWYQRYQAERRAIDAEAAADEAEELAEETSEDETAEMPVPEPMVTVAKTPVTTMWRETGMIYGWRILWAKEAPPGIDVNGTAGSLWSDIPAGLEEPDLDNS